MSNPMTSREQIVASLGDKQYRDLFVEEHITTGLAFQIRAMREGRGWTQGELARRSAQNQSTISSFENPSYGRYTLQTLKRLAAAFDVALTVRFVPFSTLVDRQVHLTPEDLNVPDFDHDTRLVHDAQLREHLLA